MHEIFDEYYWDQYKKVITQEKHQVKGLKNFEHRILVSAAPPTPLHHHSDIVEIHCLTKGKRFCFVNNQQYTITGNELFITFPFEPHNNGNFGQSPCSFYGFQIDLKERESILGLNKEYSNSLKTMLTTLPERHLRYTSTDALLLKQAFEMFASGTAEEVKTGVMYLCCFLFKLPEFTPVKHGGIRHIDKNIQRAITHIERNYQEVLRVQDLADIAGYSISRFKAKFKEDVGMTPANCITYQRIEHAKVLLKETDTPITNIAFDAGFSSSNYFCTVFKKVVNHSPSAYREYYSSAKAE